MTDRRAKGLRRRRLLQTTAGIGLVSIAGYGGRWVGSDDDGGDVAWTFSERPMLFASPTVVDGIVYVGAGDTLYALDAGVEGSSEGSRVRLGTLGYHDEAAGN